MRKQVITNEDKKVSVVILSNDEYGVTAKGISKCHPGDTYDKELGEFLANTRAWLKYYEKLDKSVADCLDYATEIRDFWNAEISKLTNISNSCKEKHSAISTEYETKMKEL